jgi:hypothetical protein
VRLHIRKVTLREWRRQFARHLRALGVAANATERAVRGESQSPRPDGIYRAGQRNESYRICERVEGIAGQLRKGALCVEEGKAKLLSTRKDVEGGWWAASDLLVTQGRPELAEQVRRFSAEMPAPLTEREFIAEALRGSVRETRARDNAAPSAASL